MSEFYKGSIIFIGQSGNQLYIGHGVTSALLYPLLRPNLRTEYKNVNFSVGFDNRDCLGIGAVSEIFYSQKKTFEENE